MSDNDKETERRKRSEAVLRDLLNKFPDSDVLKASVSQKAEEVQNREAQIEEANKRAMHTKVRKVQMGLDDDPFIKAFEEEQDRIRRKIIDKPKPKVQKKDDK